MTPREPFTNENHDDVWSLLPWYINGTLEASESTRVRRHLRICHLCQQEVKNQAVLCERIHRTTPIESAIEPALQKLMARIQQETPAAARPVADRKTRSVLQWLQRWLTSVTRPPIAWGLATVLLVAASLPFVMYPLSVVSVNRFHTSATPSSFGQFQPTDVRVVFAEPLTAPAIQAILAPLNGRIVDGPASLGVYTIRFDDGDRAPEALSSRLEQLRQHQQVVLAEPAMPTSEISR